MRVAPRHGRFLIAFGLGLAVGLLAWLLHIEPLVCLLAGLDTFFLLYLAMMARVARVSDATHLRRHAEDDDEGVTLIFLLALLALAASVTAIFLVLTADASTLAGRSLALISLPLGWATIHVLAAFRYAHLHYRGTKPGMVFSGDDAPDALDFLYASFTIGMTAQVSDISVATRAMRRAVLAHGVVSFFYNTCLLALAVNAAVTAGQ
jgi:uncharacterized membrane protein